MASQSTKTDKITYIAEEVKQEEVGLAGESAILPDFEKTFPGLDFEMSRFYDQTNLHEIVN